MERVVFDRMALHDTSHWWYCARRDILASYIKREAKLSNPVRILEIGCGTGHNLAMLSSFGHVDAIEIDDTARAIASERLGREVGSSPLPDLEGVPLASYVLIALLDVVEHIQDDVGALKAIAARLKPGGHILITVPAHQWMWSAHDEVNHHKRRYSKASLNRAITDAGLKHNGLRWFNSLLFPLAAASRLLSRIIGKDDSDDSPPPGPINALFLRIFGLERHLLGRVPMPVGLSLITLASPR